MADQDLDVRPMRKPDKHPAIFAAYADLVVGGSFVLVNDHDPRHLRDEFETDHPGSHEWSYVESGPDVWRVRITKLTATALPRVLTNTAAVAGEARPDAGGAIWHLPVAQRDLDSNVIQLLPERSIGAHTGPDVDVLINVIDGSGRLETERGTIELSPGDLVWLPRHSRRQFTAGPAGIRYLTVHRRRRALTLDPAPPVPRSGSAGLRSGAAGQRSGSAGQRPGSAGQRQHSAGQG